MATDIGIDLGTASILVYVKSVMQEIKDFSHYRANMLLPPAVYLARG